MNRYIGFILLLLSGLFSCQMPDEKNNSAENQTVQGGHPEIDFITVQHDFGEITEGEKVAYSYFFTNTGEAPLIINRVDAGCGCTAPEWTDEPVSAGEKGFVKVVFDSSDRWGRQNKSVSVRSNAVDNPVVVLRFTAEIINTQ